MKVFSLSLLLLLLAASCTDTQQPAHQAPPADDPAVSSPVIEPAPGVTPTAPITGNAPFELNEYTVYPSAVTGCDCALSLDGSTLGDEAFLFVFNRPTGPGILQIDGKEVRLESEAAPKDGDSSRTSNNYAHSNAQYRVETKLHREGEVADGAHYSGVVKVTDRQTKQFKKARVIGTCKC